MSPTPGTAASDDPPVVFRGSLDEVQEHFEARGWTDGLPIVPPTPSAVERFLAFTDRTADESLGVLVPSQAEATVWSVAVNGVMAGCRPEYMPILVAAVECVADPLFRLEDAGSTPSWEPQVVLSGPLVDELSFNHREGALKAGHRPNSTVGRFLRLFLRNVAGFRTAPPATDKGTIGMNFQVALAEAPATTEEIGWPTFGQDRGFTRDDDVVTVQSVLALTTPMMTAGGDATRHLDIIARVFGVGLGAPWLIHGLARGHWHPLLVVSPLIAKLIAADGYGKNEIKAYLHEHGKVSVRELEGYLRGNGHPPDFASLDDAQRANLAQFVPDLEILRRAGRYPDEPTVPTFPWPDQINIVVAGDPLRNQSRGLVNNHNQGVPVSRRVERPAAWERLTGGAGAARTTTEEAT